MPAHFEAQGQGKAMVMIGRDAWNWRTGAAMLAGLVLLSASELWAGVVIRDVTVVDVVSGTLRPHVAVAIEGGRIAAVTPADALEAPAGARVVDGRGRFLIPGLWDMHSHSLWSEQALGAFLPLYVAHGVTGIRDMGGTTEVLARMRNSLARGAGPWPRVVAAGQVLDGPAPVHPDISIPVADAESAAAAVERLARAGADFVKVYTLLPRQAYFAAHAAARRAGLPLAGHLPAAVTPQEAALAGQRSIEHLRDELGPLCPPREEAACARLAATFRVHGTFQVPTLVVLRNKAHADDASLATDARLAYLPRALRAEWLGGRQARVERDASRLAARRGRFADEMWLTGLLARAGVPLLAGTDAGVAFSYPGFSLHDELALLVEAGLTPLDALRAATLRPAEYLAERDSLGAIAPGQAADLVLLRADPLAEIGATRAIEAVVLRGRVLDRIELDALLEAAREAGR